jgi:hypothetical protein
MRDMRALRDDVRAPPPSKRGVFGGLFGRPRQSPHIEPTFAPPPRPRATAQVITRGQPGSAPQPVAREPGRRASDAPGQPRNTPLTQPEPPAEDLFAGQDDGTDFEIPAFLRRHANSGQ